MTLNRRLIAGAIGVSLALAACGGSSTTSPAPTSGAATQAPAASEGAATAETPTEDATSGSGENRTEDPATLNDLARTLPSSVNGVAYTRAGYDGTQLGAFGAAAGLSPEEFEPILQANGKTMADVNFAIGAPEDSKSATGGMIIALQVEGVDATKWMSAANVEETSMPKTTVAGKDVYSAGQGAFGFYAYPKGDTLYLVLLADEATGTAVLSALP